MFERAGVFTGRGLVAEPGEISAPLLSRFRQAKAARQFLGVDIRGSSPAASLCADLSQNLGLDNDAGCVDVLFCCFAPGQFC
jgi:hypothetical protein